MTQKVSTAQAFAYQKLTEEFKTARNLAVPEATLDALVQREYAEKQMEFGTAMYRKGPKELWT